MCFGHLLSLMSAYVISQAHLTQQNTSMKLNEAFSTKSIKFRVKMTQFSPKFPSTVSFLP